VRRSNGKKFVKNFYVFRLARDGLSATKVASP